MLFPDIGVKVIRKSGDERAIVPKRFIRLRDMYKASLGCGSGPVMSCAYCSGEFADDNHVTQCSLCLLPWHGACASFLCDSIKGELASLPKRLMDVPAEFLTSTCDLCQSLLAKCRP